jgi:hypothetical protein
MNNQYFRCLSFGLLFVVLLFCFLPEASTQRSGQRGGNSPSYELAILKDIPCWFVNDHALSKAEKKAYKLDATRLALRIINQQQPLDQQTIRVPDELVQWIYTILVAVRTSEHSVVDTIATVYKVHTFPALDLENLVLVVPIGASWLQPASASSNTTGNAAVNTLIQEYNLTKKKQLYLDEQHVGLLLSSEEALNMPALRLAFAQKAGVEAAKHVPLRGDGNDIEIERLKEAWRVTYRVKFGDCSQTCQKIHKWKFEVPENGEVRYLGESGSVIPPWIRPAPSQRTYPQDLQRRK